MITLGYTLDEAGLPTRLGECIGVD
jgi:hypothetical protein